MYSVAFCVTYLGRALWVASFWVTNQIKARGGVKAAEQKPVQNEIDSRESRRVRAVQLGKLV